MRHSSKWKRSQLKVPPIGWELYISTSILGRFSDLSQFVSKNLLRKVVPTWYV